MANLRAAGASEDVDELEALERMFLASREAPSARVARVGAPRAPVEDGTRARERSTTGEEADGVEEEEARAPRVVVVRDVVERAEGVGGVSEAVREANLARSAETGFPRAAHRSETTFGRSRYARSRAATREGGGDASGEGATKGRAPRVVVDAAKEDASIEEENARIIRAMSPAAIKEAQEELAGRLSAKTLDFLKNRGKSKAVKDAIARGEEVKETHRETPKRARDRSEAAAEASARTKKVTTVGVEHVRFALDGTPLLQASIEVVNVANEGSAPAPLPTERDPLRAGEGEDIGYTFQEACALTRSSVLGQRVMGLQILGKILRLARRWSFEAVNPLPYEDAASVSAPRLPNGVSWASVWVYATVDCAVSTLLRRALDDTHVQASTCALLAIHAMCGGVGVGGAHGDEAQLVDSLESFSPLDPSDLTYTAPMWRSEPENAPCGGSGFEPIPWEYAVEEIRLTADSTVELAEEPDQVEEGLNQQMKERRQATEQAADPLAAFLRMGILQRIRYLLETERSPQAEELALEMLATFARHSKAAAKAVARCPRLLSTLINRLKDSCSGGSHGSPTEPPTVGLAHVVRVFRLTAQANKEVATELVTEGALKTAIRAAVTFGGVSVGAPGATNERPRGYAAMIWRETFRFWAVVAAWGLNSPAFDAVHPLVAPWMETSVASDDSLAMDIFALLTTLSKSLPNEGGADDAGPPAELEIVDTEHPLSWRCATAAAKCAESWILSRERDVGGLYTIAIAGRFLAALIVRSPNDAQPVISRVLGSPNSSSGAMSPSGVLGEALSVLDILAVDCAGSATFDETNIEVSAWGSVLHSVLLLTIVSPDVWAEPAVTTLASQIIRKFGTMRKVVSRSSVDDQSHVRSRSSEGMRFSFDLQSERRRSTSDVGLPTGDFDENLSPTVWMGQQPIIAASKLALQRAVVVAMEILDKAFAHAAASTSGKSRLGSPTRPSSGEERKHLQEDVSTTVDAALGLISCLPPGSGIIASQAMNAGIYSVRVLEPLLRKTKQALGDAEAVVRDSCEEERQRLAIRESGVQLAVAAVTLVPPPEIAREVLLGGFAMELTTPAEAKALSAPGLCDPIGSLLQGHPLWYLAPCSPRTTVQGWGTAGIACTLSLLMGMELAKVPRVRAIRPALKMSAIGAVYVQGPTVWRDPAVSAPLGLLTDLYWRRMVKNYIQSYHQGVRGYSMDLGSFASEGVGGLNDPLNQARGAGDAAAAAAMVNSFAADSFGDALFARHIAMWLRVRVSPKARAAAWIALSEGMALHLLPCASAMVPPAAAYVFFPPGGEPDPTMRELYIKSIETGALDKALSGWAGDDYPTKGKNSPPITAALAIHALAHVILSPGQGAAVAVETLHRILNRPNTSVILRALIHTPLTIKRRPSFACASVGAHKTPFGNGFVYGKRGQDIDIPPRRTLLLDVCGNDRILVAKVENALVEAGLMQRDAVSALSVQLSASAQIHQQSGFYKPAA